MSVLSMLGRDYRTPAWRRHKSAARRRYLKRKKLCITAASHGLATSGVLCDDCRKTHRASA